MSEDEKWCPAQIKLQDRLADRETVQRCSRFRHHDGVEGAPVGLLVGGLENRGRHGLDGRISNVSLRAGRLGGVLGGAVPQPFLVTLQTLLDSLRRLLEARRYVMGGSRRLQRDA